MKPLLDRDPHMRRVALRTPAGLLAFGFGSGLWRVAPGTAGTLAAVPLALLLKQLPQPAYWVVLVLAFAAGVWICGRAARDLGQGDPGGIVWDEMVGFWLTVALLPPSLAGWAAAFVLFRLFDIFKPWPIRWLDRRVGGGFGIMLDDAVAALYAIAVLAAVKWGQSTFFY